MVNYEMLTKEELEDLKFQTFKDFIYCSVFFVLFGVLLIWERTLFRNFDFGVVTGFFLGFSLILALFYLAKNSIFREELKRREAIEKEE